MAHNVTCLVCKQSFDRDVIDYCSVGSRRYAHATCRPDLPYISPCKCIYCKEVFDRKSEECILVSDNRYAHKACVEKEATREKSDEEKLYDYIKEMYDLDYVLPNLRKQIQNFIKEYNYTYSGIQKALHYFYVVQNNPINKNRITLGIVPYVYQQSYDYYYSLWNAQQKNLAKGDFSEYIPKEIEVKIKAPIRKPFISKNFSFLDEEYEDNE